MKKKNWRTLKTFLMLNKKRLQTTSKTYYRLKDNIIQEDPVISKTKTIPQPKSSASVPRMKAKPTTLSDDTSIDPKKIASSSPIKKDNNKKSSNNNNQNIGDDDARLFSQIHLKDRKGRRSNTFFSKMKSIESAIDNLTYFSPRNVTLKPKQANIQSDGDDDENIYKSSHLKNDVNKAEDKNGLKKDAEKDTLDEFRDSDGSDLFSSSTEGEISLSTNQGGNNNRGGLFNKAPMLSLNGQINTNNNMNNINTDNKNNGGNMSPTRFEMPIQIKKNEGAPMSSPANLDDFMESDDDMLMFGSESENNQNSPLKIYSRNSNKDYSDEYDEYDYDEYDEYEIELNNFVENSPSNIIIRPKRPTANPKPNKGLDNPPKISPSPSGQQPTIDPKNTLVYAKNAVSHHRSQSRSSYSFQNQSKLDITAIIDGSLQSPIVVPVQEQENEYELDLLTRNRSNSVVTDSVSTTSRTRCSPRIPKKPDVIQFHTNGSNNNNNNKEKDNNNSNSNNTSRNKNRSNSGSFKSQTAKQSLRHYSTTSPSDPTRFSSTTKPISSTNSISGSSSGNRSRTGSMIHSQSSSRRSRTSSRSSVSSHYERIILSLMDSLSSGHKVQSDEDLVFSLMDKAAGRQPQEVLGLPADITPSKLLPIMENQQASAWVAHGCLIASLQSIPDVDSSIFCYNDMVDMSRDILRKHVFNNESRLVNKIGSLMGCNLRFNVAIIGPRNSGKSTLLRVLTDQLIAELVLSDLWRKTFVFIFNIQNFSFESKVNSKNDKESSPSNSQNNSDLNFQYEFDVRNFYLTMVNVTIQHLLWHYPQLLGITKQLTRYFESIVSLNKKHPRKRFPRSLSAAKPEIAHELQNVASIISALWNTPTAFEDFLTAVLCIPKMIAKAFNFTGTFFIIDHYDVAHRYIEPSSASPFKDASKGVWLTDIVNRAFTENTNFIIASKESNKFFEGAFMQRSPIDLYSTTDIVKRPLSKINGSISDVIFSVMVEGSDEPLLLSFDSCGGAPLYLYLWNKMNMAADDILDFRMEENNTALNAAAKLFLETLFVDENRSKIKYNIVSVKRMKKKQIK